MLSRVAQSIYWMSRYLERAENAARIIDVNAQLVLDMQSQRSADDPRSWEPMVLASGDESLFNTLYPALSERNVVSFVIFDRANPNSIVSCVETARENARCVRDQLSSEVWEQLNRLYLRLREETYSDYQRLGSSEYLNRTKASLQLFYGIAESMLPRNQAWWFFELGRCLERADNVSRILEVKYYTLLPEVEQVGSALDVIQWASVLRSCSGLEAFRKSHRGQLSFERVLAYLILDETFPRSIRFSITQSEISLRKITKDSDHHFSNSATRELGKLRAELDYALIEEIIPVGLHQYLEQIQTSVSRVDGAISETFFNYPVKSTRILA